MAGLKEFNIFIIFALIFAYIFHGVCGQFQLDFDIGYLNHRRLFGYSLAAWHHVTLHDCVRRCMLDKQCVSFNFRQHYGMCELTSASVDSVGPSNIFNSSVWEHFNISIWKEHWNLRCNPSSCPDNGALYLTHNGVPTCFSYQRRCPEGYILFHDTCYLFNKTALSWDEAMRSCQRSGATLAKSLIRVYYTFITGFISGLVKTSYWVGDPWFGIKYNVSGNGQWSYQPDGERIDMTKALWKPTFSGDCIYKPRFKRLHAADCSLKKTFICEKIP